MGAPGDYLDEVLSARWTPEELCREKDRRLAEDLGSIGPRPAWWRPRARRRYDHSVLRLKMAHASDLRTMRAAQDPKYRAIMGGAPKDRAELHVPSVNYSGKFQSERQPLDMCISRLSRVKRKSSVKRGGVTA